MRITYPPKITSTCTNVDNITWRTKGGGGPPPAIGIYRYIWHSCTWSHKPKKLQQRINALSTTSQSVFGLNQIHLQSINPKPEREGGGRGKFDIHTESVFAITNRPSPISDSTHNEVDLSLGRPDLPYVAYGLGVSGSRHSITQTTCHITQQTPINTQ